TWHSRNPPDRASNAAPDGQLALVVALGLEVRSQWPVAVGCRGFDVDLEHGFADADLVAFLGLPARQLGDRGVVGQLGPGALANAGAVDVSAVAATKIAHVDPRRLDVDQAVVPGNRQVANVAGELQVAVRRPPDGTNRTVAELVFLAHERTAD